MLDGLMGDGWYPLDCYDYWSTFGANNDAQSWYYALINLTKKDKYQLCRSPSIIQPLYLLSHSLFSLNTRKTLDIKEGRVKSSENTSWKGQTPNLLSKFHIILAHSAFMGHVVKMYFRPLFNKERKGRSTQIYLVSRYSIGCFKKTFFYFSLNVRHGRSVGQN